MEWSPIHLDGLTEILNIGMGKAAAVLHSMIGQEIMFSVPSVEFVEGVDLEKMLTAELSASAVAVRQRYTGAFDGTAVLFVIEKSSAALVSILVGDELTGDQVQELEVEAISELGNIMINGCLGAAANTLGHTLEISLPEFLKGAVSDLVASLQGNNNLGDIMVVRVRLTSDPWDVGGLIVLFMNRAEQERMYGALDEFLAAACG